MPQLRGAEPRNYRSFPRKRESRLLLVPAFAGTSGTILLGTLAYRQAPCERAVLSAAFAVSQSGRPIAILVQPTPQGVPALSHQIRHQPSSKRTSEIGSRRRNGEADGKDSDSKDQPFHRRSPSGQDVVTPRQRDCRSAGGSVSACRCAAAA